MWPSCATLHASIQQVVLPRDSTPQYAQGISGNDTKYLVSNRTSNRSNALVITNVTVVGAIPSVSKPSLMFDVDSKVVCDCISRCGINGRRCTFRSRYNSEVEIVYEASLPSHGWPAPSTAKKQSSFGLVA